LGIDPSPISPEKLISTPLEPGGPFALQSDGAEVIVVRKILQEGVHVHENGFAPAFGARNAESSAFDRKEPQRQNVARTRILVRVPVHKLWITVVAGFCLAAGAWGQGGSGAALTLSSTSVAFGNQAMRSSATQQVTLTSSGTSALTISAGTLTGPVAYSMSGVSFPLTLNPGQTATLDVTFYPTQPGNKSGKITLTTNATGGTAAIGLSGTAVDAPALMLSASSVSFGNQAVDSSVTQTVTLTASGSSALTISAGNLTGAVAYSMSGVSFPLTLNPGRSAKMEITFYPTQTGTKKATVSLTTNTLSGSATIGVIGVAMNAPALVLSARSVSFGNQAMKSSVTEAVTLTASGSSALTISAGTLTGAAAFRMSGASFPLTLNPGKSATLDLTFYPTQAGAKEATVSLTTNTLSGSATIGLSGTAVEAPALVLSPGSVSFGKQAVGSSVTRALTLTASGSSPLTISAGKLNGPAAFSMSGASFPLTLNPGQSATVGITFYPTQTGAKNATVSLTTNTFSGSQTIGLSGTAIDGPGLTVSTSVLSFGKQAVGSSVTEAITLTSSGTSALYLKAGTLSGAAAFTMSGMSFPLTLKPGQAATVNVTFHPTQTGARTATVSLATNTAAGSATVGVNGTSIDGPGLTLSQTNLAFGEQAMNSSTTQAVTLMAAGTSPLTISAASLSGAPAYSMSGVNFPLTLNPGQRATLEVVFYPTQAGTKTATVKLTTNTASGSAAIGVSGIAVNAPALTLGSTSVGFGGVAVNSPSTQSVMLKSTGSEALTISAAWAAGTGFKITSPSFPLTLNPGESATLDIKFDPASAGYVSGTATLMSNAISGKKSTIGLDGTGESALHEVALDWAAPDDLTDPAAGFAIYRAANKSSMYDLIDSTTSSQTSYTDMSVVANTSYTYYVVTVDAAGNESSPSNFYTVKVQ
jgi:hypothetical protein